MLEQGYATDPKGCVYVQDGKHRPCAEMEQEAENMDLVMAHPAVYRSLLLRLFRLFGSMSTLDGVTSPSCTRHIQSVRGRVTMDVCGSAITPEPTVKAP